MQEPNGSMRMLEESEVKADLALLSNQKVLGIGQYFKIKHTYFKISNITPEGIEAKGVSRREYFDNRR